MGLGEFQNTMLSVGAADTGFANTRMETLHGLEILAVDIGLAEADLATGAHRQIEVARVERGGQAVFAVIGLGDRFVEIVEIVDGQNRAP